MEPKAKLRLRSKGSELGPGAADRREGPAAVGDLSAAATAASMRRFEACTNLAGSPCELEGVRGHGIGDLLSAVVGWRLEFVADERRGFEAPII